jgi:predicted enzyme related to lactoylglutathione lyase
VCLYAFLKGFIELRENVTVREETFVPRVIHFEIHADDPKRAVEFYKKVFGWKISKWEGPAEYWLVTTGDDKQPGINGAIMHR